MEIQQVLNNASRNLGLDEVDSFLGNGCLIGLGQQKCLLAWGKSKKSKLPDTSKAQFYFPDFYMEEKAPWVSFENVVVTDSVLLGDLLQIFAAQPKLDLSFQEPSLDDFEKIFFKIKASIEQKEIQKAVPIVFSKAFGSVTKAMRAQYIQNLLRNSGKQTPYAYFTPTSGIFGASPEILFSYDLQSARLETMALAGTRRSDREKENPLACDEKEMFEHQLVIRGLREKLSIVGEIEISPTYVWDLGLISHLRTDISVEMISRPNATSLFIEMCQALHPTAALGVAPQTADWRYLKGCEGDLDRARYGAPFGVLSPTGKSIVLVAIRNLQFNENGIVSMGSGCGIVESSDLQNEWQELSLKRQSVRAILGL